MTTDTNARRPHYNNEWTDWATSPGFHPGKVLAVIAGLAIFPPLGIVAAGYFLWNGRRARFAGQDGYSFRRGCGGRRFGTGNEAFDAHSARVMDELRAEREAFRAFRAEERAKKDREEFEKFKSSGE